MAIGYNPSVISNRLYLSLDAANIKSYPGTGTTWTDMGLNRFAASMTAGVTYNSGNGGYLTFSSTNYATISNIGNTLLTNPGSTSGITVSVWIFPTSSGASQYVFSTSGGGNNQGVDLLLNDSGSIDYFNIATSANRWSISQNISEPLNTWINITMTCDFTTMIVYKNDSLFASTTANLPWTASSLTNLGIGGPNSVLNAYNFARRIAVIYVYDRAISANEVSQNFNALRGRFGI